MLLALLQIDITLTSSWSYFSSKFYHATKKLAPKDKSLVDTLMYEEKML